MLYGGNRASWGRHIAAWGQSDCKAALPCYAEHREVKPMELQIEPRPGAVRVIVQGPEDSEEVRRILALLQSCGDRLWVLDDQRRTVAVAPESILWAETVDNRVFVYTAGAVYQAACSLTALELRWESVGLFRCGKSTVLNLNAVQSLRSRPAGRIEAVLQMGEKIIISRRYAPVLREKLQGGD